MGENFALAGSRLPEVVRAHVRLARPPPGVCVLSLNVESCRIGDVRWPNAEQRCPRLYLHEVSSSQTGSVTITRQHVEWRSDDTGALNLPWPFAPLENGAQTVIDIRSPLATMARCYVMLEEATGALQDRGTAESTLLTQSSWPDASNPIGEIKISVRWIERRTSASSERDI